MHRRPAKSKSSASRVTRVASRVGILGAAALWCGACADFDTNRDAGPKATLGDDIYGVMCDRVGASSIEEDLSGASYHDVCHFDASGKYGDKVDTSKLPPPASSGGKQARQLSIAKLDAMVRHRSELIRAFNAAFPDVEIADTTSKSGKTIRLHDALMDFLQRMAPLYDENPYLKHSDPLIPATTRALGRLFDKLGGHDQPAKGQDPSAAALQAFQEMAARRGYRPFNVALGAIRPALAYPELRALTKASLAVIGPTGVASPELQQLLAASKQELESSRPLVMTLPPLTIDAGKAQPSRPRTNLEVTRAMLLSQSTAFAATPSDPSRFIARRDNRGFVVPIGNQPGVPGTVPSPFIDSDGDGYADVDSLGRFIDATQAPLALSTPFALPSANPADFDVYGRPTAPVYQYVDTSRTMLAAVARHFVPLLDSTKEGSGDDAWQTEHETMMYAMGGAYLLYGGREAAQYDYAAELAGDPSPIRPADASCSGCFSYTRFRGEDSPLADLGHAAGQVLADKDSDALLLGMMDLVENHEPQVARLIGALLKIREIAAAHDDASKNGSEPFATLDYQVPVWDEMAAVLARIVKRPGLTAQLLGALADPAVVTAHGTSQHEGQTMSVFFKTRDFLTYDPNNLNGPAINTTVGGASIDDPKTPVDYSKPLTGTNRSVMQRSFQVIHDANKATLCNKNGAVVATSFGIDWPLFGDPYAECELFRMDNAAIFYLDTLLPITHPKRSVMPINPTTGLSSLLDLGDYIGLDIPDILQQSSGIDGLTYDCQFGDYPAGCPSPQAINRLLYFGADTELYANMPDHDSANEGSQTNDFVSKLMNAASPQVCPFDGMGVNLCQTQTDLYRVRDFGSMFAWERLGYYDYLSPMVQVFANQACTADLSSCDTTDTSGEQLFVDLFDVLWRHWPGPDHGSECEKVGNASSNPRYCSGAGINKYEPILADAMATDLVPALNEFAIAATQLSNVTVARGPHAGETWSAAEVLEKVTRIMFDPDYAASVGMVDRKGQKSTTWTDGTPQSQLTVFTLFADALHGIDQRFDQACSCVGLMGPDLDSCQKKTTACEADATARKGQWKRARSQLVDEFFSVDGSGTAAKFHNPATPKALLSILQVVREQLNANCPTRESGGGCQWAKHDLGNKLSQVLSGPLFAGIMDVQEQVRKNDPAKRELEKMLSFILLSASGDDAFQSTLASFADILQILSDDGRFSAIFNAAATASNPDGDKQGPGCATTTVNALEALSGNQYDQYHVLDTVLPALVTPIDGGAGATPIEIMMDTIADVNRIDAHEEKPLAAEDYRAVWRTMNNFMTDDTRGLEQFYTIIQNRPRE